MSRFLRLILDCHKHKDSARWSIRHSHGVSNDLFSRLNLYSFSLAIALLGVLPRPVSAAIYYINPSCAISGDGTSGNCATSAAGIGAYRAWNAVIFAAGNMYVQARGTTYTASGIFVDVSGTATNKVTLSAYGVGAKPIIAPVNGGRGGNTILIGMDVSNVVIEGLEIVGPVGVPSGIQSNAIRNNATHDSASTDISITVQKCAIRDVQNYGAAGNDGIDLTGANVQIIDNTISNISNDGVWTRSQNALISGNSCSRVSEGEGTGDCYQVNAEGTGSAIVGNYCNHRDQDTKQCIVSNAANTVIKNNIVYAYTGAKTNTGILCDGNRCVIGPGNYVNGGAAGISVGSTYGQAHTITGNVVENSSSYSIDINAAYSKVTDNTIIRGTAMTNSLLSGIILRNFVGLEASNNTLSGFGRSLSVYGSVSPTVSGNTYLRDSAHTWNLSTRSPLP